MTPNKNEVKPSKITGTKNREKGLSFPHQSLFMTHHTIKQRQIICPAYTANDHKLHDVGRIIKGGSLFIANTSA